MDDESQTTTTPHVYTEEEVQKLVAESERIGRDDALKRFYKNQYKNNDNNNESDDAVINPKIVKQLKDTVTVFTALKELSANPLQNTIEQTVGTMAANVIQQAFTPKQHQSRDLIDTIVNSQFAYGLGQGLGNRSPELVESMGKTFGNEKAAQFIGSIIDGYNKDGIKNVTPKQTQAPAQAPTPAESEQSKKKLEATNKVRKEDRDLYLSLNINNPEHVAAYAEDQGGVPLDYAKKMLEVQQRGFILQLKKEGIDPDIYVAKLRKELDNVIEEEKKINSPEVEKETEFAVHPIYINKNIKPIMKEVKEDRK